MALDRRQWLMGGAAAVSFAASWPTLARQRRRTTTPRAGGRFGPIRPDPARVLDLPEGFSYRIMQRSGQRMDDGYKVPLRPDGMACFESPDGRWVLMRNHEVPRYSVWARALGERPAIDPHAWSADGGGGVSRVVIDPRTMRVVQSNLILAGTSLNCSGGPSPWGWLSCEETFEDRHGYVFVCDPLADRVQPPRVIPGFGRFRHEAAAVDPSTLVTYLTEDRPDGCVYRFLPHQRDEPFEGKLQALRIRGRAGVDTGLGLRSGQVLDYDWVDVGDPAPNVDVVRYRARKAGAASFRRSEGITLGEDGVYVAATKGGPARRGQIFKLNPERDGGELLIAAQSESADVLDMPDNLVASPSGLVFICEDGNGSNALRVMTSDGALHDFARNALSTSEFAGACFSPDGSTLFVNIQEDGLTLAVQGNFETEPTA